MQFPSIWAGPWLTLQPTSPWHLSPPVPTPSAHLGDEQTPISSIHLRHLSKSVTLPDCPGHPVGSSYLRGAGGEAQDLASFQSLMWGTETEPPLPLVFVLLQRFTWLSLGWTRRGMGHNFEQPRPDPPPPLGLPSATVVLVINLSFTYFLHVTSSYLPCFPDVGMVIEHLLPQQENL